MPRRVGLPPITLNRRGRGAVALLARTLPNAAGRDWRFVLRTGARAIADRLKTGAELLGTHRALSAALSSPWPEAVISASQRGLHLLQRCRETLAQLGQPWAADVIEELGKGLGLLDELVQTTQQLSVQYGEEVEQLNVNLLQREWAKAEKGFWPRSWLRKRKIRKQLYAVIAGEDEPDIGKDIRSLVRIRTLHSEVSALDIGPETDGIWAGLKTKPAFARCALNFQQALEAARKGQPWEDAGFEPIAEGRCGERLAGELAKLRTLKELDAHLKILENLGPATGGLWVGLETCTECLEAALRFIIAVREIRESGVLPGDHSAVAQGAGGAALAEDFQRLCQRAEIERQLTDCDDLREITAGLWNGLKARPKDIEQALKLQTAFSTA